MIIEQSEHIINEVQKAFSGKEEVVKKVLMAIYAGGHILMEDSPGMGKTTLALAFSKALDLKYKRVQFTTDTLPSDITGYSMYNRMENKMEYHEGAAICNLLLADEINRTSPKTQSALLEAMEERSVTVDGDTHVLQRPFICIATENPIGTTGTQALPESQLDRFMIRISIGYPSTETQMSILRARKYNNPLNDIQPVADAKNILEIQDYLSSIHISDAVLRYLIQLCEETRKSPMVELGISPRGVMALSLMAKAKAVLEERRYVIPEDIQYSFHDVCAHRLVLKPQARVESVTAGDILTDILNRIEPPQLDSVKK